MPQSATAPRSVSVMQPLSDMIGVCACLDFTRKHCFLPRCSFSGITKLNLLATATETAVAGQISYPPGYWGGEAIFVANDTPPGRAGPAAGAHHSVCTLVIWPAALTRNTSRWLVAFAGDMLRSDLRALCHQQVKMMGICAHISCTSRPANHLWRYLMPAACPPSPWRRCVLCSLQRSV